MTKIDDVCHLDHLKLLSDKIVTWDMIAYDLGLSASDIEVIKRNHINDYKSQKYQMLHEWKNKKGQFATYKLLSDILINAKEVSLANVLSDEIMKVPVSLITTPLQKCKDHLKEQYHQGFKYDQYMWPPPPPTEIYINLALIKQQNVKLNKIDDNYIKSTIHHCPDDVLKEKVPIELKDIFKFEKREKKCILIEAGPGLGKTTLSFKICRDWAAGYLLEDYEAVILLQLRLPELQKAEKIIDLLSKIIVNDDEFIQNLWIEIRDSGGDRVCFIVEGFDELPQDLQEGSIFTRLSEQLPHALIIYTSRPVAVSQLRQTLISKRIEIIGFKFEQVKEYIEKTFSAEEGGYKQTRKSKTLKLMKMIKSNTYLNRLIHIPIYLAIITHLFRDKEFLPTTRTEMYYLLVLNIILHYLMEKKHDRMKCLKSLERLPNNEYTHFLNICHLAFKGLENSTVTFNTSHLDEYDIPENINGLGLLHIAPVLSNYGIDNNLNFVHLNFQEFCAAFYICKQSDHRQLEIFLKYQDDSKFQICWQFYAGLTKLKCQHIFTSMIPKVNICSLLHKYDLVQLLLCLHEARSPDLCKQAITIMDGVIDLSRYDMDLLLCSSLSYFIKQCTPGSIKTLKLTWCGIGDTGLQYICEALMNNDRKLRSNHHLLNLDLSHNELTENGAHHIARLLSLPCIVKSLNCTGNYNLSDNGVEIIVDSLLNNCVEILELRKTGLAFKGVQAIAKMLRGDSNLKTLDISKNSLNCKMLDCLLEPLACNYTLTTLLLKWCELGTDEAKILSNIKYSVLANLDLGYNKLGDGGIASIISAIEENKTLQTLNLNVNGISCNDACYIADLLSADLSHMSNLHIGCNFEGCGLATICKAIKKQCLCYQP